MQDTNDEIEIYIPGLLHSIWDLRWIILFLMVLGALAGIQKGKLHAKALQSFINSSISSRTWSIRSSFPTLEPLKNRPSSRLPFTA